jgi:hypothetical protein
LLSGFDMRHPSEEKTPAFVKYVLILALGIVIGAAGMFALFVSSYSYM